MKKYLPYFAALTAFLFRLWWEFNPTSSAGIPSGAAPAPAAVLVSAFLTAAVAWLVVRLILYLFVKKSNP